MDPPVSDTAIILRPSCFWLLWGILEVSMVKSYLLMCQIRKWRSIQINQCVYNDAALEPELEPTTSDTYPCDSDLCFSF